MAGWEDTAIHAWRQDKDARLERIVQDASSNVVLLKRRLTRLGIIPLAGPNVAKDGDVWAEIHRGGEVDRKSVV